MNFRLKGERMRLQLSAEFFNVFNADNVIFAGQGSLRAHQPATGAAAPDARFMLLRNSTGAYNQATTSQLGNPFQAQFGARFHF